MSGAGRPRLLALILAAGLSLGPLLGAKTLVLDLESLEGPRWEAYLRELIVSALEARGHQAVWAQNETDAPAVRLLAAFPRPGEARPLLARRLTRGLASHWTVFRPQDLGRTFPNIRSLAAWAQEGGRAAFAPDSPARAWWQAAGLPLVDGPWEGGAAPLPPGADYTALPLAEAAARRQAFPESRFEPSLVFIVPADLELRWAGAGEAPPEIAPALGAFLGRPEAEALLRRHFGSLWVDLNLNQRARLFLAPEVQE